MELSFIGRVRNHRITQGLANILKNDFNVLLVANA